MECVLNKERNLALNWFSVSIGWRFPEQQRHGRPLCVKFHQYRIMFSSSTWRRGFQLFWAPPEWLTDWLTAEELLYGGKMGFLFCLADFDVSQRLSQTDGMGLSKVLNLVPAAHQLPSPTASADWMTGMTIISAAVEERNIYWNSLIIAYGPLLHQWRCRNAKGKSQSLTYWAWLVVCCNAHIDGLGMERGWNSDQIAAQRDISIPNASPLFLLIIISIN